MTRQAPPAGTCRRCGHAAHRRGCRHRRRGSIQLVSPDGTVSRACGFLTCPCSWRECSCGQPVAMAAMPGLGEVPVERGSAGQPDGRLAVRELLPDRTLACRVLGDGDEPGEGEWRGRGHFGRCPDDETRQAAAVLPLGEGG